ncbi:DUF4870 domain-containing protein [Oscillatoria sp. FACHB-1407]|uniref:DUF4870 domain-containing protein n=1 Tax=Oscillatoria sp. FACHB-1407 TaxID=2692847 RepID=UPI0016857521|nr:DUF4870 domain-containing protein [Oscillatoria sp. FACHB-1407]MBD2462117.1 DUF4870 domain-containing protein [Oscillatoria sp. FACHB-1407]
MSELEQRKLLSVICHGASLLSPTVVAIAIPILILLLSNDPIVQVNAKEAINFSINLIIYGVVILVLFISLVGIPLALLFGSILLIASIIFPIIAMVAVATSPDQPYRYPFIFAIV